MIRDPVTPAHVQLYEAVVVLASEDAEIQQRLAHAYRRHLCHIDPTPLNKDTRDKLSAILNELHTLEQRGALLSLTPDNAVEIAMRVLLAYDETTR